MLKVNACLSIVLTSIIFFTGCSKKKCADPTPTKDTSVVITPTPAINDTPIITTADRGNNWFNLQNTSTPIRLTGTVLKTSYLTYESNLQLILQPLLLN